MINSIYDAHDRGAVSRFSASSRSLFKGNSSSKSASTQNTQQLTADGDSRLLNVSDIGDGAVINLETADDDVLYAAFDQVSNFASESLGTVERISKNNLDTSSSVVDSVKSLVATQDRGRTEVTNMIIAGMAAAAATVTAVSVARTVQSNNSNK